MESPKGTKIEERKENDGGSLAVIMEIKFGELKGQAEGKSPVKYYKQGTLRQDNRTCKVSVV